MHLALGALGVPQPHRGTLKFELGIPEAHEQSSSQNPGTGSGRHLSPVLAYFSLLFLFPVTVVSLWREQQVSPASECMTWQTLYLHCQKSHAVPLSNLQSLSLSPMCMLPPAPLPLPLLHSLFRGPTH